MIMYFYLKLMTGGVGHTHIDSDTTISTTTDKG